MADINDYLLWRGDISLKEKPFNEIDALILCQLSYIDFNGIVNPDFSESISLNRAAQLYDRHKMHIGHLGVFINPKTTTLLQTAGKSERLGTVMLTGFVNEIDTKREKQFSAFTAMLPSKECCIVFRGTDDTLIGWKEDFTMAVQTPIPSQQTAVEYLKNASHKCRKRIFLAGHSKGGNLALYAASFSDNKTFKKIRTVFCFDAPGFNAAVPEQYRARAFDKTECFVPESSIVGVLLHYPRNNRKIIKSSETNGIRQHDPFSWQIRGKSFIVTGKQTEESILAEKTVEKWLSDIDIKGRRDFIDCLFKAAGSSGAHTLTELTEHPLQNFAAAVKSVHTMDAETKERIFSILKLFFKAVQLNIPDIGGISALLHGSKNSHPR